MRKVMGLKMTETVRKLAQFFLKPFPMDVPDRHYTKPSEEVFFLSKFAAVLGGSFRHEYEMLDKILLANALLDHAKKIFLVGEIGLAAVASLGFKVGRVERVMDPWV